MIQVNFLITYGIFAKTFTTNRRFLTVLHCGINIDINTTLTTVYIICKDVMFS